MAITRPTEVAAVQRAEVLGDGGLDDVLVVVLKVGANTREVNNDRDVERLELLLGSDTAELEQLGGVEGTSRNDDFALSFHASSIGGLVGGGAGVGAVEARTFEIVHSGSTRLGAALVKLNLGDLEEC